MIVVIEMQCKISSITHINMINRLYTRHKYNHYSHPVRLHTHIGWLGVKHQLTYSHPHTISPPPTHPHAHIHTPTLISQSLSHWHTHARAHTHIHTHTQCRTMGWAGLWKLGFAGCIQYKFIAKCQCNCTRNVLWCQVHSSHIHANHKTSLHYNNSKHPRNWCLECEGVCTQKTCLFRTAIDIAFVMGVYVCVCACVRACVCTCVCVCVCVCVWSL